MDIGTGKIPLNSKPDLTKIWGYDLVAPDQYFSAYDWAMDALQKASQLQEQGKNIFLVGGTGLYIDIFTHRQDVANINPNKELRESLENLSTEVLFSKLTSLNLQRSKNIDKQNKMRLIRAIEVEASNSKNTPLPYLANTKFIFIGLTAERQILYSRVDNWLEAIWKNGLLPEVSKLINLGFETSPKLHGLVYKSVLAFMQKDLSESAAIERAKFDLHAYIRRQQTWFKRNTDINWFDISQESYIKDIQKLVESHVAN